MVVSMFFLGILLLWFACFVSYLSSSKQSLTIYSPPKKGAWIVFALAIVLATYIFTQYYGLVESMLTSLLLVMVMWMVIVIVASHAKQRGEFVFSFGAIFFPSIFLLGGQ